MEKIGIITGNIVDNIYAYNESNSPNLQQEAFSKKVWNGIEKFLMYNKIQIVDLQEFTRLVDKDILEQYLKNMNRADSSIIIRKAIKYLGREIRTTKAA